MLKHTTTLLLIAVLATPAFAQETRSPEEWVARIKAEAAAEKPSQELQTLRLAAGVYITHGTAQPKDTMDSRGQWYPESAQKLLEFMQGDGREILAKLRAGQALTANEENYRIIVQACFLKAGYDLSGKKREHKLYLHDILVPSEEAKKQAVAFHELVVKQGPPALIKGYLERKLTAEDVDRIRLYRIAQGMKGVGEAFLPMHLGIHPLFATGKLQGTSHGHGAIEAGRIGKPILPLRLPTLEAVRGRDSYDDAPQVEYGFRYPLRPEGVLEFLEPVTGYEPGAEVDGKPAVYVKKELQTSPSQLELTEDQVLISGLTGEKPLLLFVNDAVDVALGRPFRMVPTVMKAYHDQLDWAFIQVNIHDWYYAGPQFKDYLEPPRWYNQHHSWSEEERARRIVRRLVENPQNDDIKVLVDTNHQLMKDRYGAGGGQSSFWLFGTDGVAVFKSGGAFNPISNFNMMECVLTRLIRAGVKGPVDVGEARVGRQQYIANPDIHTEKPEDPTVILLKCLVTEVREDGFTVKATLGEGERTIACQLTQRARILVEGSADTVDPSAIKSGMHVVLKCRFSDLGLEGEFTWPERIPPYLKKPQPTPTVQFNGLTMKVSLFRDGYDFDHDCLEAVDIQGDRPLSVCWVKAADKAWSGSQANPVKVPRDIIWRGGIVQSIDNDTQTFTIKPWPYNKEKLDGRHILKQWQDEGREIYLDDVTKARHTAVSRWLANEGKAETFYCDDAVVYTLNGLYVAGFHDIRMGDRVTVRYRVQHDSSETIPASMVRVSRVGTKTNTKQNKTE